LWSASRSNLRKRNEINMVKIPESVLKNRAFTHTALSFEPLSPVRMGDGLYDQRTLPNAVTVLENGDAKLCFYAPNAREVTAGLMEKEQYPLTRREDGVWEGILPFPGYGIVTIDWHVDGTRVLNPNAPVYYSYARPVNFIDVPDPAMDYLIVKDVLHGGTTNEYYFSKATGHTERLMVYTPPGYEKNRDAYPVLYLQHGGFENDVSWVFNGKVNFIMDNMIAEGRIAPFVIVMCNGSVNGPEKVGEYPGDLFTRMMLDDVLPFMESKYRIRKDMDGRALAGLSMGSKQTCEIGIGNPGLFAYLGIFSGAVFGMNEICKDKRYLKNAADAKLLKDHYRLLFRCTGNEDPFMDSFELDDRMFAEMGLSPEKWSAHVRRIYPGKHLWNTWRMAIHDFAQLVFR
jgi:enterochelin esterase-like enzyme